MTELQKFQRRLIRSVHRMRLLEQRPPDELWSTLHDQTGRDCKLIWERMRILTLKKLCRLLVAGDESSRLNSVARMSTTDWLMFDLVLAHEDVSVISLDPNEDQPPAESKALSLLVQLVVEEDIPNLHGEELAEAWISLTHQYNRQGRCCSPMLLQKRWYQLQRSSRFSLYGFWYEWRGTDRKLEIAMQCEPSALQKLIAWKFPSVILKPFPSWQESIKAKKVILYEEFLELMRKKNVRAQRLGAVDGGPDEPELVLLEPHVETIDLAADLNDDDENSQDMTNHKLSTEAADNSDKTNVKIKDEPMDLTEDDCTDGLLNVQISTVAHVPTVAGIDLEKDDEDFPQDTGLDSGKDVGLDSVIINTNAVNENADSLKANDINSASIEENAPVNSSITSDISKEIIKTELIEIESVAPQTNQEESLEIQEVTMPANELEGTQIVMKIEIDEEKYLKGTEYVTQPIAQSKEIASECTSLPEVTTISPKIVSDEDEDIIVYDMTSDIKVTSQQSLNMNISHKVARIIFEEEEDEGEYLVFDDEVSHEHQTNLNVSDGTEGEQSDRKMDLKLIMRPIVSTLKLDHMPVLMNRDFSNVSSKELINEILRQSKPVLEQNFDIPDHASKAAVEVINTDDNKDESTKNALQVMDTHASSVENLKNETDPISEVLQKVDAPENENSCVNKEESDMDVSDEDEFPEEHRVYITNKIFQKPQNRSYNPVQLCKNPDFNVRLKKLPISFFLDERNRKQLAMCQRITIDLCKTFERKLRNNTVYLKRTGNPTTSWEAIHSSNQETSILDTIVKSTNLDTNTIVKIEPDEEAKELLAERNKNKIITLPDMEKVRRLNQHLLTAEVPPIQVNKPSVCPNQETSHENNSARRRIGPAQKKKQMHESEKMAASDIVEVVPFDEPRDKVDASKQQKTKFYSYSFNGLWRPRLQVRTKEDKKKLEEVRTKPIKRNNEYYEKLYGDSLLAKETLHKMLSLWDTDTYVKQIDPVPRKTKMKNRKGNKLKNAETKKDQDDEADSIHSINSPDTEIIVDDDETDVVIDTNEDTEIPRRILSPESNQEDMDLRDIRDPKEDLQDKNVCDTIGDGDTTTLHKIDDSTVVTRVTSSQEVCQEPASIEVVNSDTNQNKKRKVKPPPKQKVPRRKPKLRLRYAELYDKYLSDSKKTNTQTHCAEIIDISDEGDMKSNKVTISIKNTDYPQHRLLPIPLVPQNITEKSLLQDNHSSASGVEISPNAKVSQYFTLDGVLQDPVPYSDLKDFVKNNIQCRQALHDRLKLYRYPIRLGENTAILTSASIPPEMHLIGLKKPVANLQLVIPNGVNVIVLPSGQVSCMLDSNFDEKDVDILPDFINLVKNHLNLSEPPIISRMLKTNPIEAPVEQSNDELQVPSSNDGTNIRPGESSSITTYDGKTDENQHKDSDENLTPTDAATNQTSMEHFLKLKNLGFQENLHVNKELVQKTIDDQIVTKKESVTCDPSGASVLIVEPLQAAGATRDTLTVKDNIMVPVKLDDITRLATDSACTKIKLTEENTTVQQIDKASICVENNDHRSCTTNEKINADQNTPIEIDNSKKSILSDLMAMSGISTEDFQNEESTVEPQVLELGQTVVPEASSSIDNTIPIMSQNMTLVINPEMSEQPPPPQKNVVHLSPVTSVEILKYASENKARFFKINIITGDLTTVNILLEQRKRKTENQIRSEKTQVIKQTGGSVKKTIFQSKKTEAVSVKVARGRGRPTSHVILKKSDLPYSSDVVIVPRASTSAESPSAVQPRPRSRANKRKQNIEPKPVDDEMEIEYLISSDSDINDAVLGNTSDDVSDSDDEPLSKKAMRKIEENLRELSDKDLDDISINQLLNTMADFSSAEDSDGSLILGA